MEENYKHTDITGEIINAFYHVYFNNYLKNHN